MMRFSRILLLAVLLPAAAFAEGGDGGDGLPPIRRDRGPALPGALPPGSGIDAGYAEVPPESESTGAYVIGKGMEPVISDMLGGKDELPGGCVLDTANVWRTYIRVRWSCGGKDPVNGLVEHPATAKAGALVTTDKFSVRPVGDVPWPDGFAAALKKRLETKGAKFEWSETRPNAPVAPGTFKADPIPDGTYPDGSTKVGDLPGGYAPATKRRVPVTFIVLGAVLVFGIAYQLWKRRQAKAAPGPQTPPPSPPKDGDGGSAG